MLPLSPVHTLVARQTGLGGKLAPGTLLEYQLEKLRELLDYAKRRSPYYKSALAGIDPQSVRTLEDVAALPFTDSATVKNHGPAMVCVPQREIARIVTLSTSGTSGLPKRFCFTPEDQESCVEFFAWGMSTMVRPKDTVAVFLPGTGEGGVVDLLGRGLERMGAGMVHLAPDHDGPIPRAECVVGLPAQIYALAKRHPDCRPAKALLCADYVPSSIIKAVNGIWGAEVFSHYGSTESGLGGGVECAAHSGYHLRDADLFFEIVTPDAGQPVEPGTLGEVVMTTLTRKAMPLLRYRTGDMGRMIAAPCPCGSTLHRLDAVAGRVENFISAGESGGVSIHELDEILFAIPELLDYRAARTPNDTHNPGGGLRVSLILAAPLDHAALESHVQKKLRIPVSLEVLPDGAGFKNPPGKRRIHGI